ncbi:MAG: hypothetical protein K2W95_27215 [Candidatus Obscuribacterales bacterium]|nr:hypothetical protein [Candidatus Obscuribacterales bacterium]
MKSLSNMLFDKALRRSSETDIDALAHTILLMTDEEKFDNDEYFQTRAGTFPLSYVNWRLALGAALKTVMILELQKNRKCASLSGVVSSLFNDEALLETLPLWQQVPDSERDALREELRERLSKLGFD